MNVLLFSMSGCNGSDRAALAVKEEGKAYGMKIKVVDPLKEYVPGAHQYLKKITLLKESSSKIAEYIEKYLEAWARYLFKKMYPWLDKVSRKADLFVSIHPLYTYLLALYKSERKSSIPLYGVNANFTLERMHDVKGVNAIITPFPFAEAGSNTRAPVVPLGMPVMSADSIKNTKEGARTEFSLSSGKKIITIVEGEEGISYSRLWKQLSKVPVPCTFLLLTARSSKAASFYFKTSHSGHDMRIVPHTKKYYEYLLTSDIVIGRGEAVTSSEALSLKIPFICLPSRKDGGKENPMLLQERNAALVTENYKEVKERASDLLLNPFLYQRMQKSGYEFIKDSAAPSIVRYLFREGVRSQRRKLPPYLTLI